VSGLPPLAAGDPFFRRILLVSCPETLGAGEKGPTLRQALWEERAGILQWALEGLRRVLRSARAGEGFPSGRPAEATRRRWERLGGPIGRFKEAYLKVTGAPEDLVVKRRLHEAYRGFCQREGVLAKMIDRFTPAPTEDPLISDDKRTPESGADQARCYIGATPKRDLDPSPRHKDRWGRPLLRQKMPESENLPGGEKRSSAETAIGPGAASL